MSVFKPMSPERILKALEGYQDEITPAIKAQEAYVRQFSCPRCQVPMDKDYSLPNRWRDGDILPKFLVRCAECSYTLEPDTGIVVAQGNPVQIPEDLPI